MQSNDNTDAIAKECLAAPGSDRKNVWIELLLVSFLSLFCELMIIRWLATEIRIFAYFKNLPLMAAFLGLGLGLVWTYRKTDFLKWSNMALLYLSGLLIVSLALGITFMTFVDPFKYMIFGVGLTVSGGRQDIPLWLVLRNLGIMIGVFALTATVFVGFGQRIGQLFDRLKPLEAYSVNVFGALLGTLAFSLLCFLGTSPGLWLAIVGAGLFWLSRTPSTVAIIGLGIAYSLVLNHVIPEKIWDGYVTTVWSPYYRIDLLKVKMPGVTPQSPPVNVGYDLRINYDSFQNIVDGRKETLDKLPISVQSGIKKAFETSFKLMGKVPEKVLILGGGNGSDVAAAIRCGVKHIDVIEIDPGIVKLSNDYHPEQPYASDKVTLKVMDARTFLQTTNEKYDLIYFAYVDSHAAFSSMSSLRMDNYLFTKESLERAAKLLNSNGVIVLRFLSMADWLFERDCLNLKAATGMTPLAFSMYNGTVDVVTLIAGPGAVGKTAADFADVAPPRKVNLNSSVPMSTDDWPFLFLPKKEVPTVYMLPIFAVLLLGFGLVAKYFQAGAKNILNWQMFVLGMGFMLLEVRAMADLSLLFGSTWIVNSAVIAGVMTVILVANVIATKISQKQIPLIGAGLIISLIVTTTMNVADLTGLGVVESQAAGVTMYLFPLIFASALFALFFKETTSSPTALAFNLLGGLVGVCLEYISMAVGLRAMGWIAVAIYSVCFLLEFIKRKGTKIASTAEPTGA